MNDHTPVSEPLYGHHFSPEFIVKLGDEFKFDGNSQKIIDEINYIRSGYVVARNADGHEAYGQSARKNYIEIYKGIHEFRTVLERHETQDLASDMYYGALELNEPEPQTEFLELSEFEKTRGKPYYLELLRLLMILETGVEKTIDNLSPTRGRKRDYAVEAAVRRAADFWQIFLKEKFTVDYRAGAGLTRAFLFVQKLLNEIEPVPENKIITAMRSEIANRNKSGL
jgi:hypothetical protein